MTKTVSMPSAVGDGCIPSLPVDLMNLKSLAIESEPEGIIEEEDVLRDHASRPDLAPLAEPAAETGRDWQTTTGELMDLLVRHAFALRELTSNIYNAGMLRLFSC